MLSGIAPLFAPTTVLGLVADENLRSPPIPVLLVELADIVQDRDSLHRPEKVQPAGILDGRTVVGSPRRFANARRECREGIHDLGVFLGPDRGIRTDDVPDGQAEGAMQVIWGAWSAPPRTKS